jgi:ABC-2 type transport system ATP-binding protein
VQSAGPVIEVVDLMVQHPGADRPAVDGVSFTAAPGTVLALLGPNGAGKTTTVETIEGYRSPGRGAVRVLGCDPVADARRLAPRIGLMLQRNGVYPSMNAAQMLRLFAAYYEDRARSADEVLDLVGLRPVARTPWRRLSGGEQQRLSLGLAIIGRPEVLFLDEPTAGMDPSARQTLWGVIDGLRADGATMLLTTHQLDEAERLADQVVILDKGHVVASGTPDELRRSGADDIRFAAPPGLAVDRLSAHLGGVQVHELSTGEYVVAAAPTPATIAAVTTWLAQHNVALHDLRGGRQRLEDVFLRLTTEPELHQASTTEGGSRRARRTGRRQR